MTTAAVTQQQVVDALIEGARDDLVAVLHGIQAALGWLPQPALERVAESMQLPPAQVFGVATFYEQFYLEPRGDVIVRVCRGTACHVLGAERITEKLSEKLGVQPRQTTEDRKYSLEEVACVGCCSLAPVVVVDDETHGRLTPATAADLVGD